MVSAGGLPPLLEKGDRGRFFSAVHTTIIEESPLVPLSKAGNHEQQVFWSPPGKATATMNHSKNSTFFRRLGFAWQGIAAAYRQENSFRTQVRIALAVLALLALLQPGWLWTGIILALIGLVLVAELINTALEALLDGLHPDQAAFVKLAKDAGAGAALVASVAAALAGLAMLADVFGPDWK